jgi:hypothetical protein
VPARACLVTVTDIRGVRHTADVTAESLYEAAALGLAALKHDGWNGQMGPATRIDVRVQEPAITHQLTVQQIERWLDGATVNPTETLKKQKLRSLLSR